MKHDRRDTMEQPKQMMRSTDIAISRTFDASRELVWKAWTVPEYFMRWWGPKGFTAPVVKIDLRVGGKYLLSMRSPEGEEYWNTGEFREITPLEHLVYTQKFADEKGNEVPASHYGMPGDWPQATTVTVTFEALDGTTRMTLRESGIPLGQMHEMARAGWSESLDKLADVLKGGEFTSMRMDLVAEPGSREIVITLVFDAPRELVFRTYLDPTLLPRWWGPRSLTTTVEEMDARSGGRWRYVQRDAAGNVSAFHGVFHEVASPERLVYTFEFEGQPGHVMTESVTFEDMNGMTKVTDRAVFQNVEDRDEALRTGMKEGAAESMDRFAEVLEERKKASVGRSGARASS